jgi:hypothetical protein
MPITEPIDPDAVYVCDEPFGHEFGTCRRDDELRGSHVLVSSHPALFSPVGTPEAERGSAWKSFTADQAAQEEVRKAEEAAKRERQAKANRVRLQAARVMVATEDIVFEYDGYPATIAKGSEVHEDNELVGMFPDLFEPAKR